jgi:YhcH/YjgK/YiaL family protein
MIVGRLEHWHERLRGSVWRAVFAALERLDETSPEGKSQIDHDDIYLSVMSYATRRPEAEDAVLESHRQYLDVQMVLSGSERIDWFPAESLTIKTPYDPARDARFYNRPGPAPASVDVHPGTFVVLYPEDAHMPQLITAAGHAHVKKVVVKVKLSKFQDR